MVVGVPITTCSARDCRRRTARLLCGAIALAAAGWVSAGPALAASPVHLTVSKQGAGAGSITSDIGEIDCGAVCDADVPSGEPVTLTAVAAPGSTFTGWTGAGCSGAAATCTIELAEDQAATATFDLSAAPPGGSPPAVPAPASPGGGPPVAADPLPALTPLPHVAGGSSATHRADLRPALRARPRLRGRPLVGAVLSCTRGSWGASPARYAFVWRRDGKPAGIGARYRVRAADRGHALRCRVTVANAAGTATADSAAVRIPLRRGGG
jgi:Divergent InlB B-repeat domain